MSNEYSIKQTADIFNISTNKLRFYEKKGLLSPRRRENSNYRYYTSEDLLKVQTVLMYKSFGLSIEDIKELVECNDKGAILSHFYNQWSAINDMMHNMRTTQTYLEKLIDNLESETEQNKQCVHKKIELYATKINEITDMKNSWRDKWDFDSSARNYDKWIHCEKCNPKPALYKGYNKVHDEVYERIEGMYREDKKDISILDIGTGTASLAGRLHKKGYNIIGVDQSREMLAVAKEKFPNLKLRLGQFLKLPFENKSFDCIIATYSFHHLDEREKTLALDEMTRVLKDEGKIILGDIMFENNIIKQEIVEKFNDCEREAVQEEFFILIDEFKRCLNNIGKDAKITKLDSISYTVEI